MSILYLHVHLVPTHIHASPPPARSRASHFSPEAHRAPICALLAPPDSYSLKKTRLSSDLAGSKSVGAGSKASTRGVLVMVVDSVGASTSAEERAGGCHQRAMPRLFEEGGDGNQRNSISSKQDEDPPTAPPRSFHHGGRELQLEEVEVWNQRRGMELRYSAICAGVVEDAACAHRQLHVRQDPERCEPNQQIRTADLPAACNNLSGELHPPGSNGFLRKIESFL